MTTVHTFFTKNALFLICNTDFGVHLNN